MDHADLPFYEFRCAGHTGIVMLDWNAVCDLSVSVNMFLFLHITGVHFVPIMCQI